MFELIFCCYQTWIATTFSLQISRSSRTWGRTVGVWKHGTPEKVKLMNQWIVWIRLAIQRSQVWIWQWENNSILLLSDETWTVIVWDFILAFYIIKQVWKILSKLLERKVFGIPWQYKPTVTPLSRDGFSERRRRHCVGSAGGGMLLKIIGK